LDNFTAANHHYGKIEKVDCVKHIVHPINGKVRPETYLNM